MSYDLGLVEQSCREIGLAVTTDVDRAEIDLGLGAILCFQNDENDEDSRIGFRDVPWPFHRESLQFVDACRHYIELDYLNLLTGLKEGVVLICEREMDGRAVDRWLIHFECSDEFKYLEGGEKIIVRRAMTYAPK